MQFTEGGKSQPGCGWTDVVGACAHGRAYEYYIESIVRPEYFAFECQSYEELKSGNCSVVNRVVQMAGEPGIQKYVNLKVLSLAHNNERINFKIFFPILFQSPRHILSGNKSRTTLFERKKWNIGSNYGCKSTSI